jgi:hypothetical protein
MADFESAGTQGDPFPVTIEAGKVAEFADALGSTDPAHRGIGAVAPATFLTVQNFYEKWAGPGADPWQRLDLDPLRELHAAQEFVYHGEPPAVGSQLLATSRIESVTERRSGAGRGLVFAVMVTEYRDADRNLVAEARCTGVERPEATDE